MAFSWRGLFRKQAPATKAIAAAGITTKSVTIVDDGFIPRDVIQFSDIMSGRAEEGLDANVVMAPVLWIMRTFTEATVRVQDITEEDRPEWIKRHPVERLMRKPNNWYNGDALWQATVLSYTLNGNAYWQKIRNSVGQVIQLWYRPHWCMKPHAPQDGSAFIDYYDYDTGRGIERLNVRDVVHFRFGLDPRDPRYGFSPLRTLLREVFTDQEAARFSMRILENMGIPGVVVSPTLNPTGASFAPERSEVEALKDYIDTVFTGTGRGKALVFGEPTTIQQFGFDPAKLTLAELRDGVEERVCAVLGLPASVVGFGSGMDQTKIGAVMEQHVKLAWRQCLFPMHRGLGRQLDDQLLSDFTPDYEDREQVAFDVSKAVSLQENTTELSARVCNEVKAGLLRVDHAQAMMGYEVDETQAIYLRPLTVMPVPSETVPEPVIHPNSEQAAEMAMDAASEAAAGPDDDVKALAAKWLARMGNGNGSNGHHTEEAA
jgi:HK97 family phage portal protein